MIHTIENIFEERFDDDKLIEVYLKYMSNNYLSNEEWSLNLFSRLMSANLSREIYRKLESFQSKDFMRYLIKKQKADKYWIKATQKSNTDLGLSELEKSLDMPLQK